jgi:pimeloyl-ACP methyl ester carboxylesterase
VIIATLTDAVEQFLERRNLRDVDIVGSLMGARIVVELARRGHAGNVVAIDPGGFWNDTQARVFNGSITASIALVRRLQPVLPSLVQQAAGRTALLAQFSAAPYKLDLDLVLTELRGFATSPSLDEARRSLAHEPRQAGAP